MTKPCSSGSLASSSAISSSLTAGRHRQPGSRPSPQNQPAPRRSWLSRRPPSSLRSWRLRSSAPSLPPSWRSKLSSSRPSSWSSSWGQASLPRSLRRCGLRCSFRGSALLHWSFWLGFWLRPFWAPGVRSSWHCSGSGGSRLRGRGSFAPGCGLYARSRGLFRSGLGRSLGLGFGGACTAHRSVRLLAIPDSGNNMIVSFGVMITCCSPAETETGPGGSLLATAAAKDIVVNAPQ